MTELVYLGLGSSAGDRLEHIKKAERMIVSLIGEVIDISGIYETTPWGFESTGNFLNMALSVKTDLSPGELLEKIHFIESSMGRVRESRRYAPRVIDIDILFYGNKIIKSSTLTIPHPLLHERKFVLVPLCSIAPDFVHPCSGMTIVEHLEVCRDSGRVWSYC
ncbi:MAG: 2-amino-4-hydroxy-6-hydroxymethyldihydropteridine diphosphokinase [Bacteroidales bacterium]